jgi:hypothetical protein
VLRPAASRNGERRMFRIAITLIVLFWTAAANADDDAIIAAGKAAVTAKLLDPDSARFTDVRLTTDHRLQYVCGHVAARDRKGVYTDKTFVFIPKQKNPKYSAIIYDGRSITNDRFSAFAQPIAFTEICGN